MSILQEHFGVTAAGESISKYTLTNRHGISVSVLDWGGVIQSISMPNMEGVRTDVVLGYDTIDQYEKGSCYFGAFVGRYANRIKGASFELNGETYELPKNDGNNHLHGTYCRQKFQAAIYGDTLMLALNSPDGEEGFPGQLYMTLAYTLTETNRLVLDYRAIAEKDTVVNFTNHTYFNLDGVAEGGDVLGQMLRVNASTFTEGDEETLPTGKILSVEGTPFDFRTPKTIGQDLFADDAQLKMTQGYDHNLIFDEVNSELVQAEAFSPKSGIDMKMYTTQPAMQLYTGNFVDGDAVDCGKGGVKYPKYGGFCLETQHYPCSPNFPEFPSTVLKAGETYHESTVFEFALGYLPEDK